MPFLAVFLLALCACKAWAQNPDIPSAEAGKRIVSASCETCHSLAPGVRKIGPSLAGVLSTNQPRSTPDQVRRLLLEGRKQMPAYGAVFDRTQIDSILLYLKELP